MAVCWDVGTCSLVDIDRHLRGAYYLHYQGPHRPDDGGSKLL
jgi:hypothetical protein